MKEPNVTVFETTATDFVKDGYTGQILGVECQTKSKGKDFVSRPTRFSEYVIGQEANT